MLTHYLFYGIIALSQPESEDIMTSALQTEIKQRKAFAGPEDEAMLNIMRTHSVLTGISSALLKEQNLSAPLYNILRILRGAGDHGARVHDIGDRMVAREPDMTRLIDRLEKLKLARRERCKVDRRVIYVHITPAGLDTLATLDGPVREMHRKLLGHMSATELATISRLMVKAREPHLSEK
ncbi:MAG: hypothetical protein AMXMBFR82_15800 [Candidatus Hydrogenedentota bacterium]